MIQRIQGTICRENVATDVMDWGNKAISQFIKQSVNQSSDQSINDQTNCNKKQKISCNCEKSKKITRITCKKSQIEILWVVLDNII